MKYIKFFATGLFFGIVLTKSEAISWFRIYEMFQFQSFHMYGIIGVAIATGVLGLQLIKRFKLKNIQGNQITIAAKEKSFTRYIVGGILFGLGWGLVGACPGPIFILLSTALPSIGIVLFGALIGTYVYGLLKNVLPH